MCHTGSGSDDGTVCVWDPATLACVAVLAQGSAVLSLAALPRGGFASGCADGVIAVWSAKGERVTSLGGGAGFGAVASLAVLPDARLAAGYTDAPRTPAGGPSVVRVWNVKRRALDAVISGHANWVWSLVVLRDGRLASGSRDRTVKVWDEHALGVRGGAAVDTCAATLAGHADMVTALAVLADSFLASGSIDGTVREWR